MASVTLRGADFFCWRPTPPLPLTGEPVGHSHRIQFLFSPYMALWVLQIQVVSGSNCEFGCNSH